MVALTLLLAVVLLISALLNSIGAKRELIHVLHEKSKMLITTLEKGSKKSLVSYALTEELVAERLSGAMQNKKTDQRSASQSQYGSNQGCKFTWYERTPTEIQAKKI